MSDPLFLFGTLRHAPLRDAVLGSRCGADLAILTGWQVLDRGGYPALFQHPDAQAEGLILSPDPAQLDRLDLYERLFGYARCRVSDAHGRAYWVYRPETRSESDTPKPGSRPWALDDWVARLGAAATLASAEVMNLAEHHPISALTVRYPMLLSHACARLRGAAEQAPQTLRRAATDQDVLPVDTAHPYAYFFGVQSDDLRFRRFDGSFSPVVRRAAFIMSDAVTVLPYDPVRDCVMLVEQFRYGLYLRRAANCWSLEAIAGRIDPGESPGDAALREAQEEAGLTLDMAALHLIGQAYPSPGAITECLYQYVAIGPLPEDDGAVNGLATEQEDIRRHVIGFDQLMQLVQSGEAQNGPLITTAYWLALNRARLRADHSAPDL